MRKKVSHLVHLFTDADNTLWDTNSVFACAQLSLLRDVEKLTGKLAPPDNDGGLSFLRRLDQEIANSHADHLRYPPAILARGLQLALSGRGAVEAAKVAMEAESHPSLSEYADIVRRYLEALTLTPPLRDHVREGLRLIANAGIPITVVSEERRERCLRLLQHHSLDGFILDVVSVSKSAAAFRTLKAAALANRVVMVGDQLDRDIRAASEAGFETFYFPGGFQPYWLESFEAANTHLISRYDEIVPYVAGNITNCSQSKSTF